MKVFITGVQGFIGQNFMNSLPSDWIVNTYDLKEHPDLRPRHLDIEGNDWVIHLGGLSSTTETDPKKVMDLNLAWSIEMAEECEKYGVNLQWSSSASVYGNKYYCPVDENKQCYPLNLYANSKYFFEEYMKSKNPDVIWQGFRYFNVYGPHEEHKGSQARPYSQFAKQARETGIIKVFEGSEKYKRDFIHVNRIIDLHFRMIEIKESGIFNMGTGSPRSFLDVARDVALFYNAKIEEIPFPKHLIGKYQEYTHADMYKLNMLF